DLPARSGLNGLLRLHLSLGEVPAPEAVDSQQPSMFIGDGATGGLHKMKILPEPIPELFHIRTERVDAEKTILLCQRLPQLDEFARRIHPDGQPVSRKIIEIGTFTDDERLDRKSTRLNS